LFRAELEASGSVHQGAGALNPAMIAITISSDAYATIAATLAAGPAEGQETAPDREHLSLVASRRRQPPARPSRSGETFSDLILPLAQRGSYAAITR
jgi:hypothetical protein